MKQLVTVTFEPMSHGQEAENVKLWRSAYARYYKGNNISIYLPRYKVRSKIIGFFFVPLFLRMPENFHADRPSNFPAVMPRILTCRLRLLDSHFRTRWPNASSRVIALNFSWSGTKYHFSSTGSLFSQFSTVWLLTVPQSENDEISLLTQNFRLRSQLEY